MSYKNAIISLLAIAVVGFATWITNMFYHPSAATDIAQPKLPDAYMEGVVALVMDKSGDLSMKIMTPKLVHYSNGNIADLTTPEIVLYRGSTKPWYLTAQFGQSKQGIDQVDFWENVAIFHPEDEANPDTWINTNTLTIHPHDHTAFTRDKIKLTQTKLSIQAVGMDADLKNGDIKLLSEAQGEYTPDAG